MSHTNEITTQAAPHRRGFLKYSTLFLVVGLLAFAFIGKAYSFGGHRGHNMEAKIERLMDKVDVSDSQRAEIRSIMDAQRPQFRALRDQMKQTRKALISLDPLSDSYDAETSRLASDIAQGSQQLVSLMASGRKQIWLVLDEAQRAEAKALMEKVRERRSERRVK